MKNDESEEPRNQCCAVGALSGGLQLHLRLVFFLQPTPTPTPTARFPLRLDSPATNYRETDNLSLLESYTSLPWGLIV